MPRRLAILLITTLLIVAACSGGDDDAPSGVTTASPTPEATTDAAASPVATRTATPTPTETPTPSRPSSTAQPTTHSNHLAALGGEDSAVIAQLLGDLTPRCQQPDEELTDLLERAWRALRETYDIALPVTSIIARILVELPAESSVENCETLITAVITEVVASG